MVEQEQKTTSHKRTGTGRVMHPNSLKNLKKRKVHLRYISVATSAMALSIVALGVLVGMAAKQNAAMAAKFEAYTTETVALLDKVEDATIDNSSLTAEISALRTRMQAENTKTIEKFRLIEDFGDNKKGEDTPENDQIETVENN